MNHTKSIWDHWTALALVISFLLVTLLVPGWTNACFLYLSQPILWGLVILTVLQIRKNRWQLPSDWKIAALSSAVGTILVALTVESGFRVLSDEANLVGVSRSLLYEGTPSIPVQSRWSFDRFWVLESLIPKRPLLFPFLLANIHRLLGYHYENAFSLNLVLLFVLLGLAYFVGSHFGGKILGISLQFFALAQPILPLTGTSAGFDLLAVLATFSLLLALSHAIRKPSHSSFSLLLLVLLWMAHTRYESILALPLVGFFLWKRKILPSGWMEQNKGFLILAPLVLCPRIWQHALTWNLTGAFSPAGIEHLWTNLKTLSQSFVAPERSLPYASVLNGLAVLGILACLFLRKRATRQFFQKPYVAIPLGIFLFELLIKLSVSGISYSDPNTFRLFLGFSLSLSFLFFFSLVHLRVQPLLVLLLSIVFWASYHPIAMENRSYRSMDSIFEAKLINEFLDGLGSQRVLLVSDRPVNYTIRELGSIDFEFANRNMNSLLKELNDHLYDNIYIVQRIPYGNRKLLQKLADTVELEPVFEYQTRLDTFLRISRVTLVPEINPESPALSQGEKNESPNESPNNSPKNS